MRRLSARGYHRPPRSTVPVRPAPYPPAVVDDDARARRCCRKTRPHRAGRCRGTTPRRARWRPRVKRPPRPARGPRQSVSGWARRSRRRRARTVRELDMPGPGTKLSARARARQSVTRQGIVAAPPARYPWAPRQPDKNSCPGGDEPCLTIGLKLGGMPNLTDDELLPPSVTRGEECSISPIARGPTQHASTPRTEVCPVHAFAGRRVPQAPAPGVSIALQR